MNNESHRLGEPFDERANEDGYFALKEHALMEKLKSEHQKAQAAERQVQMTTCPKCSGNWQNIALRAGK
jgi:hypothetical protein